MLNRCATSGDGLLAPPDGGGSAPPPVAPPSPPPPHAASRSSKATLAILRIARRMFESRLYVKAAMYARTRKILAEAQRTGWFGAEYHDGLVGGCLRAAIGDRQLLAGPGLWANRRRSTPSGHRTGESGCLEAVVGWRPVGASDPLSRPAAGLHTQRAQMFNLQVPHNALRLPCTAAPSQTLSTHA